MATEIQIETRYQGGARKVRAHRAALSVVSGVVGVTGAGSITGGAGYTNGTYPLALTGGTLALNGAAAQGTFTVSGGAVTAITVSAPGQYSTAPTGFSFVAAGGSGASATPTTAQVATMTYAAGLDNYCIPPGSYVTAFKAFTASTFAGLPTNANLVLGTAFGDSSYVANTDIKAQGEYALTKVAAGIAALRPTVGPISITLAIVGVTTASGSVDVEIHYLPPSL